MQVSVGYCDNPNSAEAGTQVVADAMSKVQRAEHCDMVLMFCTAKHDVEALRSAVSESVGAGMPIYGGGAVGVITNDKFGYAGDQVGVALIWFDDSSCEVFVQEGLLEGELAAGKLLGEQLANADTKENSSLMLFYDAVNMQEDGPSLIMATWILQGLQEAMGFLPPLTGAGLQGDHMCSPVPQFAGDSFVDHSAMALKFSDDIKMDSVIMHGCRPASAYYTVTKADGPVILEINNTPAIEFMDSIVGPTTQPEDYSFFLIFGINHGDKWGEYDEKKYASRLCLGIDKERGGIVMFEPDMVEGTEFQLMRRSLELDYMKPKLEEIMDGLKGREPLFAMYIDCAGRCAGYGGVDIEDAVLLQEMIGEEVPLLGLYTGVEIAPIGGRPRGLDWTGVFCVFSKKSEDEIGEGAEAVAEEWSEQKKDDSGEIPLEALLKLCEQNAAKILDIDNKSIAIRHELEQKRRGFSLLAELAVSLRRAPSYESIFVPVAQRINAALNMQKTVVMVPADNEGGFTANVLQGYSVDEKVEMTGKKIKVPQELLEPENKIVVTAADPQERYKELREALKLPYFVSSPIIIKDEVTAVLITGRNVEQTPFLSRLSVGDHETVQAISALMASIITQQRLESAEERSHLVLNAMPITCVFWDENGNLTDCNEEALSFFGMKDKAEFIESFYSLSPEKQADGKLSQETMRSFVISAFVTGTVEFEWDFQTQGELLPTEVKLVRVPHGEDYVVAGYIRDLRQQKAAIEEINYARELAEKNSRMKTDFIASVSHEVRTPINGILAMARAVKDVELDGNKKFLVEKGVQSAKLLASTIDGMLDFSSMEAGRVSLSRKLFSPRELAENVAVMLLPDAQEKNIELISSFAEDVPEELIGDSARLQQAIFNIAANAVKFTKKGEVRLNVSREAAKKENEVVLAFEIADTGIGISKEQIEEIFRPLNVADATYTREFGGLGMGLAISKNIAMMMGGDVAVESEEGKGSAFTLTAVFEIPEAKQEKAESTDDGHAELAGLKVLVAEDNAINQIIISELLTAVGIDVHIVADGQEALTALESEQFDIVLMDIQMPRMDGLTAASKIRENPQLDDMPILAMTANAGAEHIEESLNSGMNDHLTKPIDVDEMYTALKHWSGK